MQNFRFMIQNLRCFEGRQEFEIRPLTFLIGENSTGKTTSLACLNTFYKFFSQNIGVDFNTNPYEMGVFNDIIRKSNKSSKQNTEFAIGLTSKKPEISYTINFIKNKEGEEPIIKSTKIEDKNITVIENRSDIEFHLKNEKSKSSKIKKDKSTQEIFLGLNMFFHWRYFSARDKNQKLSNKMNTYLRDLRINISRNFLDTTVKQ